jgi:hypothetical protein
MSVVTGKPFAKELLTPSGRSGKLAHKSEFVVCALTGVNLLPTEVGTSSVSGKVVDLAKLATSEVSGNIAIRESEMSQCAATNTWAIQSELAECEVSNKRVLPSVLRDCAVTQMTASSSFMVKSEFSQSWMLKDQAKRSSLSGKTMLPSEACRCVWSDEVIANAESRICERTGLPAKPGFVTRGGVLIDFERLMARRKGKRLSDGMKSGEFAQWLRTCADERVPEFQNAWFLVSPTKRYILLCLEVWKYLGIKTSYYGLVVQNRTKKSPFKIVGRVTTNSRKGKEWTVIN